jgi:hypothetical protein
VKCAGESETSKAGELILKRFQALDGRLTKDWPTSFEKGSMGIAICPPTRLRSLSALQLQLSAVISDMYLK